MDPSRPDPGPATPGLTRRGFLRKGAATVAGASALAAALSPLKDLAPGDRPTLAQLLQRHYKEMTPEEKRAVLERVTHEVAQRYQVTPRVSDPPPLDGVEYVYALNLSRCIGCRKCVHACVRENNQSRAPEIQYIRVLKMEKGSIDVETSDHHYDPPIVPEHDSYYMPVQCHQCKKPPCVKACPVEATWQEPDGITVIDYD
ncbi:MAG TPA: 4Fe-4S dicluster domain-containing protein, partial [Phycisphaerae bacterium]|nr:4Fe-4S dicluster domain-containing protein [Phycisphaerae bacterium]